MGPSISAETNTDNQNNLNEINTQIKNECNPKCSEIQCSQEIIIIDSTVGDIRFNQECNVNAQCAIQSSVNSAVKSIQKGQQDAEAKKNGLNIFNFNISTNDSTSDITNTVTEIIKNECGLDINLKQKGNLIYVQSSKTGDISFNQKSTSKFKCSLKTSASISTQVEQQTTQKAKTGGLGTDGLILLIVVIVIVLVLLFGFGRSKSKSKPIS